MSTPSFAAELLHFPDLFPVRHSGERWGEHELCLSFAGGPYLLQGLSISQRDGLRDRYGDLAAGPPDDDAIVIRVLRAPASDFRELEPEPWRRYPLEIDAAPAAVRIASRRFFGRLDWRPETRGALWTPVDGDPPEILGVFENFLRVLAAYRLNELGGVLLHSAGVVHEARAYLFVGASGAGKTTLSRLSRDDGKIVLSDDMNVVLVGGGGVVTENLPFAGDLGQISGPIGRYPVAGIFRLEQATKHSRQPLAPAPALATLVANSPFLNSDPHRLERLTANLESILATTTLETLAFSPDAGFWPLVIEGAA